MKFEPIKAKTPEELAEYEARPEVIARRRLFDVAFDRSSAHHADLYVKAILDALAVRGKAIEP